MNHPNPPYVSEPIAGLIWLRAGCLQHGVGRWCGRFYQPTSADKWSHRESSGL